MADSGAIRSDITIRQNVRPSERRRFRFRATDADGADIPDLTGRTYSFYVLTNADVPLTDARLTKTTSSGIAIDDPPYVDVTLAPSDWAGLGAADYSYELWRTDAGAEYCVAYGDFIVHRGARQNRLPVR